MNCRRGVLISSSHPSCRRHRSLPVVWDQYVASTGLTDDLPARDEFALLGSKHLTILSKKHQDMPLADVLDLMFQEFDDYEKEHLNKCFYQS